MTATKVYIKYPEIYRKNTNMKIHIKKIQFFFFFHILKRFHNQTLLTFEIWSLLKWLHVRGAPGSRAAET